MHNKPIPFLNFISLKQNLTEFRKVLFYNGFRFGVLNFKLFDMAKIETISLKGCSGKTYNFDVYPIGTNFKALGAVYCISKRQSNNHTLIYLGITDDLLTRFNNHHKEDCFKKYKANCVSIHLNSSENEREQIEKDILCNYNFLCNEVNN